MYTFHAVNESDSNSVSTKGSLPKQIRKTKDVPIKSRIICLEVLASTLQIKFGHWIMKILSGGWSLRCKKLSLMPNVILKSRCKWKTQLWLIWQHNEQHHKKFAVLSFLTRSNLLGITYLYEPPQSPCNYSACPPASNLKITSNNNKQSTTLLYMYVLCKCQKKCSRC